MPANGFAIVCGLPGRRARSINEIPREAGANSLFKENYELVSIIHILVA